MNIHNESVKTNLTSVLSIVCPSRGTICELSAREILSDLEYELFTRLLLLAIAPNKESRVTASLVSDRVSRPKAAIRSVPNRGLARLFLS